MWLSVPLLGASGARGCRRGVRPAQMRSSGWVWWGVGWWVDGRNWVMGYRQHDIWCFLYSGDTPWAYKRTFHNHHTLQGFLHPRGTHAALCHLTAFFHSILIFIVSVSFIFWTERLRTFSMSLFQPQFFHCTTTSLYTDCSSNLYAGSPSYLLILFSALSAFAVVG